MRKGWFALLGLMLWLMPDLHGEILGDVLAAHNVALDVLTVRERQQPITSFAVSAAEFPFLIAYYDDDGTGTLPAVLHVFRYDARIRALSRTDLRGEGVASAGRGGLMRYLSDTCMGSALAVSERNGFVTIQTHINPSAGCVLILTSDLKWTAGLWGWVLAPVGKMLLFEENCAGPFCTYRALRSPTKTDHSGVPRQGGPGAGAVLRGVAEAPPFLSMVR